MTQFDFYTIHSFSVVFCDFYARKNNQMRFIIDDIICTCKKLDILIIKIMRWQACLEKCVKYFEIEQVLHKPYKTKAFSPIMFQTSFQ